MGRASMFSVKSRHDGRLYLSNNQEPSWRHYGDISSSTTLSVVDGLDTKDWSGSNRSRVAPSASPQPSDGNKTHCHAWHDPLRSPHVDVVAVIIELCTIVKRCRADRSKMAITARPGEYLSIPRLIQPLDEFVTKAGSELAHLPVRLQHTSSD